MGRIMRRSPLITTRPRAIIYSDETFLPYCRPDGTEFEFGDIAVFTDDGEVRVVDSFDDDADYEPIWGQATREALRYVISELSDSSVQEDADDRLIGLIRRRYPWFDQ